MVIVEEGGLFIIILIYIILIIVYWVVNVGSIFFKVIVLENKNFKRKYWYIYFFKCMVSIINMDNYGWKLFIFVFFNDIGNYLKFIEIKIIFKYKEFGDNVILSFY